MNLTIDAALASILTAVIVGILSTVTTLIANGHAARQQRAQWDREERRAEREAQKLKQQQERESQETMRVWLQDIYGNAIASLSTLSFYSHDMNQLSSPKAASLAESQKWCSFVVASHYDKESDEYEALLALYESVIGNQFPPTDADTVNQLRQKIIKLMSQDPRLHYQ